MSRPSLMTSPTLIPMRNSIRRSGGTPGVSLFHLALHFDSTTHRINDTGEFEEQAISGGLNDTAPMFLDLGIGQLAAKRLQRGEGPLLVRSHQPRVAGHVGREDRGETAFDASWPSSLHGASPVPVILHQPGPGAH